MLWSFLRVHSVSEEPLADEKQVFNFARGTRVSKRSKFLTQLFTKHRDYMSFISRK